jgi:spermidine/putrescine transport system permease protein
MRKGNPYLPSLIPLTLLVLFLVVGPLIFMVLLSFATNQGASGFTWDLTLANYRKLADPVYLDTFRKSLGLAFFSTLIIIAIGYPAGYCMSRLSKKGKTIMLLSIVIPFGVNSLIRLYGIIILLQSKGVVNSLLLRLHLIKEPLKMLYSYPAVVLGMVYALLPFMILAIYSSAEKLDWTLVEAARDLGASKAKAFATIIFPLTLPGLFSGVVLSFVPAMGLFFIADFLGGNKIVLVGSLIQDQMTRGSNWPFAAAIATVLTVITSFLLLAYRKVSGAYGEEKKGDGNP